MKITVRYWSRLKDLEPNYNRRFELIFEGETAKSCMAQVEAFKDNQDIGNYTRAEIINVED